ncbi:MAG: hypothetical protein H7125_13455 [Proteobacteria bacterium]|nr:hypothetical protein [Burkholderiales bacterium]
MTTHPASAACARVKRRVAGVLAALMVAWWLPFSAAIAATYTESVNGEISGDRLRPTFFQLDFVSSGNVAGANVLSGTAGRTGSLVDRDYLHVNVPQGFVLTQLLVGNQTTVGGGGSFIGLAAGAVIPIDENAVTADSLLGFRVYGLADRGTDILDDMAVPDSGSSGFVRPLGAGDYALWIQELAPGTFSYRFNLVLAPDVAVVPLPAASWMFAGGLLLGARALPRKRRRSFA